MAACGGAANPSPVTPAQAATVAVAEPAPPPPIPRDLWLLVPSDAMAVAELDLGRLRQWSHHSTLLSWLSRYGCVPAAQTGLLERVERAVAAVRIREPRNLDAMLVLRGAFQETDAAEIAKLLGPDVKQQARGRWQVHVDQDGLVALLDETTLLVASGTWGDESIKLADATGGQHVRSTAFVQDLMPRVGGEGSVLVAMAAPSGEAVKEILRDLQRWGGSAAAIAKGLAAEPYWGARVALQSDNAGVTALAVASGGSEADATALIEATGSAFWQAGLFMRLIGLPPTLSNASLQHVGAVATVGLQATGEEGGTLLRRLEDLVKASAEPCVNPAEPVAGPTP